MLVPFGDRDLTRQLEGVWTHRPGCGGHQGPGNREALLTEIPAPPTTAPPAASLTGVATEPQGVLQCRRVPHPPSEVRTLRLRAWLVHLHQAVAGSWL